MGEWGGAVAPPDGWISEGGEVWTYASADSPTFTFTVAADVTTKYSPGMRIKLTQTTVKYFIITAVSTFSGGNTTITIYGGTDYTLVNAVISLNYHSRDKAPFGFPLNPIKWTVETNDANTQQQNTPATGTWYNPGGTSIVIPIGIWEVRYEAAMIGFRSTSGDTHIQCSLSTSANAESDIDLSCWMEDQPDNYASTTFGRAKTLVIAAKTTYYLVGKSDTMAAAGGSGFQFRGSSVATVIRALCAYL